MHTVMEVDNFQNHEICWKALSEAVHLWNPIFFSRSRKANDHNRLL